MVTGVLKLAFCLKRAREDTGKLLKGPLGKGSVGDRKKACRLSTTTAIYK